MRYHLLSIDLRLKSCHQRIKYVESAKFVIICNLYKISIKIDSKIFDKLIVDGLRRNARDSSNEYPHDCGKMRKILLCITPFLAHRIRISEI